MRSGGVRCAGLCGVVAAVRCEDRLSFAVCRPVNAVKVIFDTRMLKG